MTKPHYQKLKGVDKESIKKAVLKSLTLSQKFSKVKGTEKKVVAAVRERG
jgi:hypothetical protein